MSKKYDITDTMAHVQKLYEAGHVTYPRTDCPYLPESQHSQAQSILDAIVVSGSSEVRDLIRQTDSSRKSPAWNNLKIAEHHAIIPTTIGA